MKHLMIFLTYKHKCIVDRMMYVTHRLRVETSRPVDLELELGLGLWLEVWPDSTAHH